MTQIDESPAAYSSSVEMPTRLWTSRHWLVLVLVWVLSTAYMATYLKRGWVPHDEGSFGQSAWRVLNGQLPHRDFDELYTGGLDFLHALAFRELGENLMSMRYVLFAFFVAWVPAVFYIASRFLSDYLAAAVTLLAVAWSVPNYAAAVPSWYNLFFAVFGTAALLRYLETNSRRWLFAAGFCAGLSILAKIAGLFFVAGVLLFFLFREQNSAAPTRHSLAKRGRFFSLLIVFGLSTFVLLLFLLVRQIPRASEYIHFVLPGLALAVMLVRRELFGAGAPNKRRIAGLSGMLFPFTAGVAAPVLVFLMPFFRSHSLPVLFNGIFVLPAKRFGAAGFPTQTWITLLPILCLAAFILFAFCVSDTTRLILGIVLAVGLAGVLVASMKYPLACEAGWYLLAPATPLIVLAGAIMLGSNHVAVNLAPVHQQRLMLLFSVTAMSSLVQFPFSAPIYFCYVAPLTILAATALLASTPQSPRLILGALAAFYLLFGVLIVTPSFIYTMGYSYTPDLQTLQLALPRAGGIRIDPGEAQLYQRMIPLIQAHAIGEYMYAAPDCPEVYFLSGLQNPTRTLFDFFDDPTDRTERILSALENRHVNVVAIKRWPSFSRPMSNDLERAIEERFPHSTDVGLFVIRWAQ